MSGNAFSGGCQCGAVRFRATRLGRPSICHCRMCQKQFGGFFGAFVTAYEDDLAWTRGEPAYFRSSAEIERGFCARCGTPLTYRHPGGIELSIGSFDHPEALEPEVQVNHAYRLPWIEKIFAKPLHEISDRGEIVSYQHPDRDTDQWPPARNK
jgi:hypothetical protein